MTQPLISVIIPFYNNSATISRALQSVISQSWQKTEIIVVDDASTIDEKEKLHRILADFKQVILCERDRNGGAGRARNFGFASARGNFVCFLDADDEMYPDKLKDQYHALITSQADAVLSDYHEASERHQSSVVYEWWGASGSSLDVAFGLRCGIQLVGMLFRKKVLDDIGGFRTMPNGQDKDLFLRSLMLGHAWIYQKGFVGKRNVRSGSISSDEKNVLVRNCRRNVMLLTAHQLKKTGKLESRHAQILAEKIAMEARRWAHFGNWEMAQLRWNQACALWEQPKIHGTRGFQILHRAVGFIRAEKMRAWIQSFNSKINS